jgi:2-hydroxychromene-2-carboxylate isomerase
MADSPASDLDFHFDPACPFAWVTSRWITRVRDLTGVRVGWRLISLKILNEERPPSSHTRAHEASHRYLRVLAAVLDDLGPDPIWSLYTAWGERLWYDALPPGGAGEVAEGIDIADLLGACGVDARFAAAADDESWDADLRRETDAALERTGPDVGTPILTFWPGGNTFFGPVISTLPADDDAVRMYEAMRTLVDFETFSEIKRTKRPTLDLPAFRS